jgi:hypothetical protein
MLVYNFALRRVMMKLECGQSYIPHSFTIFEVDDPCQDMAPSNCQLQVIGSMERVP